MIAIETKHHVAYSSSSEHPYKACAGKCKKAWWKFDFETRSSKRCPQCGGKLKPATESKHYTVVAHEDRELNVSDFAHYQNHDGGPLVTPELMRSGMNLQHVSIVKPEFVEKARSEWC